METETTMIIGYDGKRAVANMTGIGNYSRLVIGSVAEAYPEDKLLIYTPKLKKNPRLKLIESLHNVEFRVPPPSGFGGSLWRTFGITNHLRPDKVDIYHGLSNELPLNIRQGGVATVVTIHDVIWRVLPHTFSWADRHIDDYKYGASCRNATRIIAISENTKNDIVKYFGINPDKIDIIYQGCDDSFKKRIPEDGLEETRRRLNLPERYVLQVGTIEERKNLALTVKAMAALPEDIKLVAVGKDRRGYKGIVEKTAEEAGVAGRIIFRDDITFADLPAVNRMACVIAYPSRYEGFGIPVLEGLESEVPVVAAKGSCLEEAGGPGSIYVDPDSPQEMAEALRSVVEGRVDIQEIIGKGKEYARKFDNSTMAQRIMEVYKKTIREFEGENESLKKG